jgi:hypothetical protein
MDMLGMLGALRCAVKHTPEDRLLLLSDTLVAATLPARKQQAWAARTMVSVMCAPAHITQTPEARPTTA